VIHIRDYYETVESNLQGDDSYNSERCPECGGMMDYTYETGEAWGGYFRQKIRYCLHCDYEETVN
jgi:hypothetical protein